MAQRRGDRVGGSSTPAPDGSLLARAPPAPPPASATTGVEDLVDGGAGLQVVGVQGGGPEERAAGALAIAQPLQRQAQVQGAGDVVRGQLLGGTKGLRGLMPLALALVGDPQPAIG